jgi:hypothetical protein
MSENVADKTAAVWLSQIRTVKDAYASDPEDGREEQHMQRRAFWHGVYTALDLIKRGGTVRQVDSWLWGDLQSWRYSSTAVVDLPPILEPWREIRERIFERDGNVCAYCGAPGATHIDHVVPVSAGGSYEDSNLVVACRACNLSKGTKSLEEWRCK